MGLGCFAHDIGKACVALRCADLKGVHLCREADCTDRYGPLAGFWLAGIQSIQLNEKVLRVAAKVVANDMELMLFVPTLREVAKGLTNTRLRVADTQDGIIKIRLSASLRRPGVSGSQ